MNPPNGGGREGTVLYRLSSLERDVTSVQEDVKATRKTVEDTQREVVALRTRMAVYTGIGSAAGAAILAALLKGFG